LSWFEHYLTCCSQWVVLAGQSSEYLQTNAGVPQGSVLGPLLFLIFINDIENEIKSDMTLFADDCSLIKPYYDLNVANICLNSDLVKIGNWAERWMVNFNFAKTVFINFSNKINKSSLQLVFNNPVVEVFEHKHLGLTFSSDMKWSKHMHISVLPKLFKN